jgi:DNA-3-methyladenine glycosylase II
VQTFISVTPPFSLELTVWALRRRPNNIVDLWDDGVWSRVVPTSAGLRLWHVRQVGPAVLSLQLDGGAVSAGEIERLAALAARMLGTSVPLTPFYQRATIYPNLARLTKQLAGMKPPRYPDLFEALVNAVVFQQVSLASAAASMARYVQHLGRSLHYNGRCYFAFPTPEATTTATVEELRLLGFSRQKARVVLELAARVIAGQISVEMLAALPDEDAIATLEALPGIGPWSARLVLLRGLGRLSVFPLGDVGARNRLAELFDLPKPIDLAQERAIAETFGEWRGLLYFYLLGQSLLQQHLIAPATDAL